MIETEYKSISAEEFLTLNRREITVVDVREPDEVLVHEISGAINVPYSAFAQWAEDRPEENAELPEEWSNLPKDQPIYVICWIGENSAEVTKTLEELGYDARNVEGGFLELRSLDSNFGSESEDEDDDDWDEEDERDAPAVTEIDARGLKCPGPIVKVADTLRELSNGDQVYVTATEDAFASDIRVWCEKTGNTLLDLHVTPELIEAQIEKGAGKAAAYSIPHGKNFVVFSGDLDKTIAAFIMANGSAAMGRQVTMFFTFWGLNILRKPTKVSVAKSFMEKMFSAMMPRGTYKLGLSRMNMGGMGAKMIRGIMKKKNISSLEELMQNAMEHGVRIIACQMSMDIMGITKEELIDGVELGGVSTFLGSAEESDMSLFI